MQVEVIPIDALPERGGAVAGRCGMGASMRSASRPSARAGAGERAARGRFTWRVEEVLTADLGSAEFDLVLDLHLPRPQLVTSPLVV